MCASAVFSNDVVKRGAKHRQIILLGLLVRLVTFPTLVGLVGSVPVVPGLPTPPVAVPVALFES